MHRRGHITDQELCTLTCRGGGVGNDHKLLGQKTDIFQGLKNSTSWRLERGKNIIRTVPSFLFLQINYNL